MTSIKVNPQSLYELANQLNSVHDQLLGDNKTKNTVRAWDLGAPELHHALEDFAGRWDDSFNVLETNMRDIITRLRSAAGDYQNVEQQLAQGASSGQGSSAPPQDSSGPPRGARVA